MLLKVCYASAPQPTKSTKRIKFPNLNPNQKGRIINKLYTYENHNKFLKINKICIIFELKTLLSIWNIFVFLFILKIIVARKFTFHFVFNWFPLANCSTLDGFFLWNVDDSYVCLSGFVTFLLDMTVTHIIWDYFLKIVGKNSRQEQTKNL